MAEYLWFTTVIYGYNIGLTRSHLLSLSAVLNVPLDSATAAAAQMPQLLLLPPQELQSRLQTLSNTLKVRRDSGLVHMLSA
jgi:hypothetical protein